MKKLLIGLSVVTIVALAAIAYAQPGWWGGGHMMGYGYGMGPGMMGGYYGDTTEYKKFLDETSDLRKKLHEKRFEYFEAVRNPETKQETIAKIEKEIRELENKLYEKTPRTSYRGGYGGYNCPMGGW